MIFLICIFLNLIVPDAHAVEEQITLYKGIRSMGMGGVVTTTGNYAEALFNNPARHSEVEHSKFSILDLTLSVNDNLVNGYKDLTGAKGGSGSSTISKASSIIGKNEHVRMDLMLFSYYNPRFIHDFGFAFGYLLGLQNNLGIHYTTDLDAQFVVNTGPNVGISHRFFDEKLSLGINAHVLYRLASDTNISALDFLTGQKSLKVSSLANQGGGVDFDVGGYYFVPWNVRKFKLSLGGSVNNVMQSTYRRFKTDAIKSFGGNPPGGDRLMNLGTRLDTVDFLFFKEPVFAFEVQNIGTTTKEYSFFKKLHFGGETKVLKFLSLRSGMNQGYYCGGLGFNFPLLKIDLATYGQELSGNAGVLEDRRYMLRLALEI